MVVGGARPRGARLVAGGDRRDLVVAARRELRVPLAVAGAPGRPGGELLRPARRDDRRAGIVAGGGPALHRLPDDPARPVRRLESADDRAAHGAGPLLRRRAGAHGRPGPGVAAAVRLTNRSATGVAPDHPETVGARPMPW